MTAASATSTSSTTCDFGGVLFVWYAKRPTGACATRFLKKFRSVRARESGHIELAISVASLAFSAFSAFSASLWQRPFFTSCVNCALRWLQASLTHGAMALPRQLLRAPELPQALPSPSHSDASSTYLLSSPHTGSASDGRRWRSARLAGRDLLALSSRYGHAITSVAITFTSTLLLATLVLHRCGGG